MLSVAEALARVLALVEPLGTEEIPLAEAGGRVLAADVVAVRDQPPFAASAMDGYALRNAEADAIARAVGLDSVMDRCVKIDHARLFGGLHRAGVNTGVISARRPV